MKIIPFPVKTSGETRPMMTVDPSPVRFCLCNHVGLCEITRTARCTDCGRKLEAFDALKNISNDWSTYARNLKSIHEETLLLSKQRDELRREVMNLKAQKKRLGGVKT